MEIYFLFEVTGDFNRKGLSKKLKSKGVELLETDGRFFVHGATTPGDLVAIIIICGKHGVIKGGEFVCE